MNAVGRPPTPKSLLPWLSDDDPAIRWQVLRDLQDAEGRDVDAARCQVATAGWGARLLARQDADGRWAGALYSPKWTSTTYTLLLLHWLGLPADHPQAMAGCQQLWDGASCYDGGLSLAKSIRRPEACITAMMVLLASSFGYRHERIDPAVDWLIGQQLGDGGWNCESIRSGSRHGSFHTSISTLDALLEYSRSGRPVAVQAAMDRGRMFFLDHRLYRSHRTGAVVNPAFTRFPFPPQWHFDVLRGLEHFRAADQRDDRLADAVAVIRRARRRDGTWPGYRAYPGRTWFQLEPAGPSRWSTLRALRLLRWWDAVESGSDGTEGIAPASRSGPVRSAVRNGGPPSSVPTVREVHPLPGQRSREVESSATTLPAGSLRE